MNIVAYTRTLLLLILALPLWAHDGKTHEEGRQLPLADRNAPVAIDAPTLADEQRSRNYFTDLSVTDQNGKRQRFYSDVLRGRVVLINFIYTHCEEGCPVITDQLSFVRDKLGERFGKDVFFVSISTDAERDTPAALKAFAEKFDADQPGWIFLTGAKADMDQIITRLGQYSPVPEEHSSLILAGNVTTRHWMKLRPTSPLPALVYKLQELVDETVALR